MWARRLGVPHLWPSRVKVFFLGLFAAVFIFSVFQYLHNANVSYLDLAAPAHQEIVCKLPREECREAPDPVSCLVEVEDHNFWSGRYVDLNISIPCPALPEDMRGQSCHNPSLPLAAVMGENGLLHTVNSSVNPFKLWSILFLSLTSLLSLSIVIHDLALLEERLRPRILSIPNLRYATPCLWDCLFCVRCRRCMQRLRRRGQKGRYLWMILVPLTLIVQTIVFMIVVYPFSLFVCLISPVRMSRMMVFLSAILCILWSVVFVLVTTCFDYQQYAVLWSTTSTPERETCVCMCEYPLSHAVIIRIAVLGLGVCIHSLNYILRALRGLRRGQWANMFSVLYAVPVEAFPVFWERPNGGPMKWRSEGQPVQSEPAFDPFCLMDEQPESAMTRAAILPVVKREEERFIWEPYTGNMDTEIACCGFPRPAQNDDEDWNPDGEAWNPMPEPLDTLAARRSLNTLSSPTASASGMTMSEFGVSHADVLAVATGQSAKRFADVPSAAQPAVAPSQVYGLAGYAQNGGPSLQMAPGPFARGSDTSEGTCTVADIGGGDSAPAPQVYGGGI